MKELKDELLDYDPEERSTKGEKSFKYNKRISSVRFAVVALLIVNIIQSFIAVFQQGYSGTSAVAYYLGLLIPVGGYGWYCYYNVRQALMELKEAPIYPVFRQPFVILFMLISVILIIVNVNYLFSGFGGKGIITLILLCCYSLILQREMKYYRLLSKSAAS